MSESQGLRTTLVIIDCFSQLCTAMETVEFIFREVIMYSNMPKDIVSDREVQLYEKPSVNIKCFIWIASKLH